MPNYIFDKLVTLILFTSMCIIIIDYIERGNVVMDKMDYDKTLSIELNSIFHLEINYDYELYLYDDLIIMKKNNENYYLQIVNGINNNNIFNNQISEKNIGRINGQNNDQKNNEFIKIINIDKLNDEFANEIILHIICYHCTLFSKDNVYDKLSKYHFVVISDISVNNNNNNNNNII